VAVEFNQTADVACIQLSICHIIEKSLSKAILGEPREVAKLENK